MMDEVKVEQVDRDAAADWLQSVDDDGHPYAAVRSGQCDNMDLVQAFARHRLASQSVPSPDLVERCRKVLSSFAVSFGKPVHLGQVLSTQELESLARAIIPIIQADEREECAKVGDRIAQQRRNWQRGNFGNSTGLDEANGAEMVATTIRKRNGG